MSTKTQSQQLVKIDFNIYDVYLPSPWRQAAAHLATGFFPFYPASEGKHQLTASNLTERLVSQTPAVTPLGHTYASVPMPPSPEHCSVERGEKRQSDGGATIKTESHLFFSPPFSSPYKFTIGPFWRLWFIKEMGTQGSTAALFWREEVTQRAVRGITSVTPASHQGTLWARTWKYVGHKNKRKVEKNAAEADEDITDSMWHCTVHSSYFVSENDGQYCLRFSLFLSFVATFAVSCLL